jgi:hypothetical protein
VGNVYEWVADWVPRSTACGSWSGSSDEQCLAGAATTGEPGALVRGGLFSDGSSAGPFAVGGSGPPSSATSASAAPASQSYLAIWPFALWRPVGWAGFFCPSAPRDASTGQPLV